MAVNDFKKEKIKYMDMVVKCVVDELTKHPIDWEHWYKYDFETAIPIQEGDLSDIPKEAIEASQKDFVDSIIDDYAGKAVGKLGIDKQDDYDIVSIVYGWVNYLLLNRIHGGFAGRYLPYIDDNDASYSIWDMVEAAYLMDGKNEKPLRFETHDEAANYIKTTYPGTYF